MNYMASAPYVQKQLSRIVIESIKPWNHACVKANGGTECNDLAMSAYMTLSSLPTHNPCAQQRIADDMIDLSKSLDDTENMIRLAQLFVQQPLPTLDGYPLAYCQERSRNVELKGLYPCQFEGTILNHRATKCESSPLDVKAISPRGSCPALNRPLPNGHLLHAVTSNPFGMAKAEQV
ncbi:hypothetical protein Clacol_007010 [Clathrus columnatus]|uniref:Uncharacterized protein n=1 Tax=Clathrus columnatus TaxID=1419009 RepID=A0AAV5AEV6_9AGAM|nr:hypothetical protein Clacol_007010 [Clathrus columnatus]